MDQAEVLPAQGHRLPNPVPNPGGRPDPGACALVPVQRLDDGDPVCGLSVRQPQDRLHHHARCLEATPWQVPQLRRFGDPLLRHSGGEPLRDANRHLWCHRHVGRSLPAGAVGALTLEH
ncbi:hypothetical protein AERO8C_120363 [Aeromonas veronii]|uniref:Uncharacterized protein n=1 Tax=Aeromonas veronii TaxID=654 RepID=A0A653KRM0_AERVE|nr:hypothetical protein AERO8C_120363 [Aeromonas veronii]